MQERRVYRLKQVAPVAANMFSKALSASLHASARRSRFRLRGLSFPSSSHHKARIRVGQVHRGADAAGFPPVSRRQKGRPTHGDGHEPSIRRSHRENRSAATAAREGAVTACSGARSIRRTSAAISWRPGGSIAQAGRRVTAAVPWAPWRSKPTRLGRLV